MMASNVHYSTLELFQGKSQAVKDIYNLLLGELNKIGPFQETKKALSISFENRKAFASAMIRNRSIKLVLRTSHKINNSRILSTVHVTENSFDHTVLLESKKDIDQELIEWLGDAYQTGK